MSIPVSPTSVGVEVTAETCTAGVVAWPEGRVLIRRQQATRPERGGEAVLADVVALVRGVVGEAHALRAAPACVGVGIAAQVSHAGEVLDDSPIGWKWLDAAGKLRSAAGVPTVIDAEVRAAARGEALLGAGCGFRNFLYAQLGSSLAACVVVDQAPYAGGRGLAGNFAAVGSVAPAHGGGLASGPALADFASTTALARRLALAEPGFDGGADAVLSLAETREGAARQIVQSAGQAVGAALAALVNFADPDAVVLGGPLGLSQGLFLATATSAFRKNLASPWHAELPLVAAELGADAGLVGAALTATLRTE